MGLRQAEETTTPQEVTDSTATTSQAQVAAAITTVTIAAAMTEAATTAEGALLQVAGEIVPVAGPTAEDSRAAAISLRPPTPEKVEGPRVGAIPKGRTAAAMEVADGAGAERTPETEAIASVLDRDDSKNN